MIRACRCRAATVWPTDPAVRRAASRSAERLGNVPGPDAIADILAAGTRQPLVVNAELADLNVPATTCGCPL
jgi:hypothetical protein